MDARYDGEPVAVKPTGLPFRTWAREARCTTVSTPSRAWVQSVAGSILPMPRLPSPARRVTALQGLPRLASSETTALPTKPPAPVTSIIFFRSDDWSVTQLPRPSLFAVRYQRSPQIIRFETIRLRLTPAKNAVA